MKRFLLAALLLACFCPFAQAADKISELLIHPEETRYARFEVTRKKITLVSISAEPDDRAQVIVSLKLDAKLGYLKLRVENKFPQDLLYRAEVHFLKEKREFPVKVMPVVAGKLAYENFPSVVEEIALFDFKLQK
jgi:hypothetical protein